MRRQFFDLKPGESVAIGNSVVTAEAKTGQRIRIKVESDEPTHRGASIARPQNTQPAPPPFLPRPGKPD